MRCGEPQIFLFGFSRVSKLRPNVLRSFSVAHYDLRGIGSVHGPDDRHVYRKYSRLRDARETGMDADPSKGEIGVLDRRDMDHFPDIFMKFQELGREPSAKREYIL